MITYRHIISRTRNVVDHGHTDFGLVDRKRRGVGYLWSITQVRVETTAELSPKTGSYGLHPDDLPETYFQVYGAPTRNGSHYGPSSERPRVATLDEAEKIVARRINGARKRDSKKFKVI